MQGINISQYTQQIQTQTLSLKQIQSLSILNLSSDDLRGKIYSEVEENPALIILKDKSAEISTVKKGPTDNTRVSSSISSSASMASDTFQSALEAQPDQRESLKQHLLSQLHMMNLSEEENILGEKLIHNLDNKGFHILSPVSLLDRSKANLQNGLLAKVMSIIQHFDPVGTCTSGVEQSLYVQASINPAVPPIALLILDNHLSFLDPPVVEKVSAKIKKYQTQLKSMIGLTEKETEYINLDINDVDINKAINFIKSLDPYPARDFGTEETRFVSPDIYVEKLPDIISEDNFKKGLVYDQEQSYLVKLANQNIPELGLNPEYEKIKNKDNLSEKNRQLIEEGITKAQNFISCLQSRDNTLQEACCQLVKKQINFFKKGPGFLDPLTQTDLANIMGIHETTVSRIANNKYIQCEWGLFDIKYFFTTALSSSDPKSNELVSKDHVLLQIQNILEQNKNNPKKLSDQKISDLLAQQGIKVARRTVAKYREQLNINSSYKR